MFSLEIDMLSWEIYEVCLVNFEKLNLGVIFSSNLSTQENKNYLSFNSKEEEGRLEWGMSGNVFLLEVRCWETFKFWSFGEIQTHLHIRTKHTHIHTHTHTKHTYTNTHTRKVLRNGKQILRKAAALNEGEDEIF